MIYLITPIDPVDEFDTVGYAILEVTRDLVNRLRNYGSITNNTLKAHSINFEESCFDFTDNDLEKQFPEIGSRIENLAEGQFFSTTIDLSLAALQSRMEVENVDCCAVKICRDSPYVFTFSAYSKHNAVEYWFQITLEKLEAVLKEFDPDYLFLSQDQKEKYLKSSDICPKCESTNIESAGQCQTDCGGAWQEITCKDCGFSWQDIYSLTDVMEMRP